MELREYLEEAERQMGGRIALAEELEQHPDAITSAKKHRRGLPVYACVKLAAILNEDPIHIIAASELVTEKREDRKAVFLPFVQMGRLAHPMIVGIVSSATVLGMALDNVLFTSRTFLL